MTATHTHGRHQHIVAIAVYSLALAGRLPDARVHATALHAKLPRYAVVDFLAAVQFDPQGAALFRKGARRLGTP